MNILLVLSTFKIIIAMPTCTATSKPLSRYKRMINGERASIEGFPYLVALFSEHKFCGGAIISPIHVITAAHCIKGLSPSSIKVRAGSSWRLRGGSVHRVRNYSVHEKYYKDVYSNSHYDLAILQLEEPILLDNKTKRPIVMFDSGEETKPGSTAKAAGWGRTDFNKTLSTQLRSIKLRIVDRNNCSRSYQDYGGCQEGEICAIGMGAQSTCSGDSGGSLVVDGKLAGIAAHGGNEHCRTRKHPKVFMEIAYFRKWIDGKTSTAKT